MQSVVEPEVVEFVVNAGLGHIYNQAGDFHAVIEDAWKAAGDSRVWRCLAVPGARFHVPGQAVWLFRRDEPGESEQTALFYLNYGLCDLRVLIRELSPSRMLITVKCYTQETLPAMKAVLREFARRYTEAAQQIGGTRPATEAVRPAAQPDKPPQTEGRPYGGTLDRVREAHELIKSGMGKTEACRRVKIDPRTYDRYAEAYVDWEGD